MQRGEELEAKIEGWNVVIAGNWNVSIFNPDWVSRHLFGGHEVQVELRLAPEFSPRYSGDGIQVLFDGNRLLVHPQQTDQNALNMAEQKAILILELLPHTPVIAVGINFRYVETEPSPGLEATFHFDDNDRMTDAGFELVSTEILRQLRHDGRLLNLKLSQSEGSAIFNFNYHTQVNDTTEAINAIRGHVLELEQTSVGILNTVYHAELLEVAP